MASVNMAIVVGFVGDDPRVNSTQSGRKVASFLSLRPKRDIPLRAVSRYPIGRNGIISSVGERLLRSLSDMSAKAAHSIFRERYALAPMRKTVRPDM